ncbi:hypothetical protein EVAR_69467_1 [Eumeta japonica]|uniref:Uncharacterized protein n=1 Tax=Eumeta variegata TaxID=151549 RepID=A0A4C2A9D2_EUMVA|nr:hypothetical protein EVAR_69467_1 [Eumeta japonica]
MQLTSAPESNEACTLPSFSVTFMYLLPLHDWRVGSSDSGSPPLFVRFAAAAPLTFFCWLVGGRAASLRSSLHQYCLSDALFVACHCGHETSRAEFL